MGKKNPQVDEYIANAAAFAQPILKRLRSSFHKGCPQIEETIKWGVPCFEHGGIVGSMAAFKKHVGVGYWKSKQMQDPENILEKRVASMCNAKFTSAGEMPSLAALAGYAAEGAALNAKARQMSRKSAKKKAVRVPPLPPMFRQALAKSKKAKAFFDELAPSHRRDYIEWIDEAKRDATRQRRIAQAIEWLQEQKTRNWKYERQRS